MVSAIISCRRDSKSIYVFPSRHLSGEKIHVISVVSFQLLSGCINEI